MPPIIDRCGSRTAGSTATCDVFRPPLEMLELPGREAWRALIEEVPPDFKVVAVFSSDARQ
jgi:hypothetical protein